MHLAAVAAGIDIITIINITAASAVGEEEGRPKGRKDPLNKF